MHLTHQLDFLLDGVLEEVSGRADSRACVLSSSLFYMLVALIVSIVLIALVVLVVEIHTAG